MARVISGFSIALIGAALQAYALNEKPSPPTVGRMGLGDYPTPKPMTWTQKRKAEAHKMKMRKKGK